MTVRKSYGTTRARGDEGAETVEFALIVLPLFGFIFLILSLGWVVFAKASLQHAVREGVRYAVTSHATADIQAVVQANSFGFLAGDEGVKKISVGYLTPGLQKGSQQGGNLVEVTVSGVSLDPFGLAGFGLTPLTLSAVSSDIMEGSAVGNGP